MKRLFALRNGRWYLAGQTFSILGSSALWLVAGIWVKELTGSNAAAGLTFFFLAVPSIAAPLTGMIVDHVRRKPLLLVVNAVSALAVLPLLFVRDAGQVWLIWTVMTLYGVLSGILGSAESALLTTIIPNELLPDANGALRTIREGLRLVAPLAGAGLFAVLGGGAVAIADAATFLIAIVTLLRMRVVETTPTRTPDARWRREITAGFRHLWSVPDLRNMTIATGTVLLVVGFIETVAFAVVGGLHQRPTFIATIITVQGIGAVVGGLSAAPLIRRIREPALGAFGMIAIALGIAAWIVPSLPVVLAGAIVVGAGLPWLIVAAYTLVQRRTPDGLQGRVFAAFDTAVTTPQTISIVLGAVLIAFVPYPVLLAIIAVVSCGAGLWLLTRKRTLDTVPADPYPGPDADAGDAGDADDSDADVRAAGARPPVTETPSPAH